MTKMTWSDICVFPLQHPIRQYFDSFSNFLEKLETSWQNWSKRKNFVINVFIVKFRIRVHILMFRLDQYSESWHFDVFFGVFPMKIIYDPLERPGK